MRLVVVLCGCLLLVGIGLSTLLVHSALPPELTNGARFRRAFSHVRRRDEGDAATGIVAASYARYSSDQQDASSIDQQRRKCREKAVENGHDLRPELEFADEAMSGTRVDRGGFQGLLAAARDRKFQVLYFESLSRMARELVISIATLKELVYVHRVRVISTSEGIDSDRTGWELLAFFRSWMHGEFLVALRSAVLRGQEEAVLSDYSVGDWCFGYASEPVPGSESGRRGRNAKPRMRVVVREDHARWVRQIFQWFVTDRWSIDQITRELTKQNAPKDHRSTKPHWHHDYVLRVLKNRKYLGVWPWGRKTNVRNPLTGQVSQEDRTVAEVVKYERERPELRLVDDLTFFKAEELLAANAAKIAACRTPDGRIRGSTRDSSRPRHLLQGLIRCGACGAVFQVSGAGGKYLGCTGYRAGSCACRPRLRRDRAERLVLAAVGESILQNPVWHQAVLDHARAAWETKQASRPDDKVEIETRLGAVEGRIARLVDAIEAGNAGPEVRQRLDERRREREELLRRRGALIRDDSVQHTPPTAAWVTDQLKALHGLISSGEPAAAVALRNLLGAMVVVEVAPVDRRRRFLRGTAAPSVGSVLGAGGTGGGVSPGPLVIDFTDAPPWASIADRVKDLFDRGVEYAAMTAQLGCPRSWPAKALTWWHRERGLPPPDGRKCRARLTRESETG
ncbi:MAG: hypothetical protein JWO38_7673 [Gemmataceae bacterium]|nr:hypothetical protein [Gemmataceae bacterium]